MAQLFTLPRSSPLDAFGQVMPGAMVSFYTTGGSAPRTVYADAGLTVALGFQVQAGDDGSLKPIYLDDSTTPYKVVITDSTGAVVPNGTIDPYTTVTQELVGGLRYQMTAAEISAGFTVPEMTMGYEPGDVRRYGILPNDASRRAANTAALLKLVSASGTSTFKGRVRFTNTTGADTYYLGEILNFKDGIQVDLAGSTLHFTKTAVTSDVNVGFITAIRDFAIENGSIIVDYNAGGTANRGNALMFGWRDSTAYYPNSYDSLLSSPMGNITVRNLRIRQNTALSNAVLMFSGLNGVTFDGLWIDGQGTLGSGIQYEFGWATNEANRENRQTSHLSNASFRNIDIKGVTSGAFQLTGAYSAEVKNLRVNGGASALTITCGESLFYRPWVGVDDAGAKRNIKLQNIIASDTSGTAITLTGAQNSTGYLSPLGLGPEDETDLLDVSLDGFSVVDAGGNGVHCSAGKADIRNGHMLRCDRGIVLTDECTQFAIDNVTILDSASIGVQLNQAVSMWSPARKKVGSIRNSFIAGSGTAGTQSAIVVGMCESVLIEDNRLGYELAHDGIAETKQSNAVNAQADAFGVICRGNYVGGTSGGAVAYQLAAALSSHRGCSISGARGVITRTGRWLDSGNSLSDDRGDANVTLTIGVDHPTQRFATTLTANRAVTLSTTNAVAGSKFRIVREGLGAFTLSVGGLKTIASATAAFVDVEHDGTAWRLTGYGAL